MSTRGKNASAHIAAVSWVSVGFPPSRTAAGAVPREGVAALGGVDTSRWAASPAALLLHRALKAGAIKGQFAASEFKNIYIWGLSV